MPKIEDVKFRGKWLSEVTDADLFTMEKVCVDEDADGEDAKAAVTALFANEWNRRQSAFESTDD